MKNLILKKIMYLGNDFYKIIDINDNIDNIDEYDDFNNVLESKKELFYYEIESESDFKEYIGKIVGERDGEIFVLPDDLSQEIEGFIKMEEDYHNIDNSEIKDIVDIISKKYPFQKQTIMNLLKKIFENQSLKNLDVSSNRKRKLLKSILYIGSSGCNKENILDDISNLISIPCVEINISLKDSENVNKIMEELLSKTDDDLKASNGIVFVKIKENIDDVIKDYFNNSCMGNEIIDIYLSLFKYLTGKGIVEKNGRKIDFRTLTFVASLDILEQTKIVKEDIFHLMNMSGAQVFIVGNEMSIYQKIYYLMSENGPLMEYAKYFESFGKKLLYDPEAIGYLVQHYHNLNFSINVVENILDEIMDYIINQNMETPVLSVSLVKSIIETIDDEKLDDINDNKTNIYEPTLKNIYDKTLESVVGQDKQVKEILYNILLNQKMANMEGLDNSKQYIKNILLRGESGGGKTFIISTIAKLLNIPMFVADATSYTEAGYVGNDVTDMLVSLYHVAGDDLESAQKGIIVIDEIDKKAGNPSNNEVTRGAVLNSLLKIVEGSVIPINVGSASYPEEVMFDTSKLTIIASGAFEEIEKIRDKRVKKELSGSIGFSNNHQSKNVDNNITDKDYVEFGMVKQFMARFPVIVNLNKNTKESLKNIMINSSASALKIEAFKLYSLGINVEYTDDFCDELAEMALSMEIGVRGIDKALQIILSRIHVEDLDYSKIEKIVLNKECIHNPDSIIIVPKKRNKIKEKKIQKNGL